MTEEGEQILHFWEYNWQTDRMTQRKYEISASEKCVHTYFCCISSFSLFFSLLSLTFFLFLLFLPSLFPFFFPSFLLFSIFIHYSSFIYFISFHLFYFFRFYKQEYCGCSYSLRDSNLYRKQNNIPPVKIGGEEAGLGRLNLILQSFHLHFFSLESIFLS